MPPRRTGQEFPRSRSIRKPSDHDRAARQRCQISAKIRRNPSFSGRQSSQDAGAISQPAGTRRTGHPTPTNGSPRRTFDRFRTPSELHQRRTQSVVQHRTLSFLTRKSSTRLGQTASSAKHRLAPRNRLHHPSRRPPQLLRPPGGVIRFVGTLQSAGHATATHDGPSFQKIAWPSGPTRTVDTRLRRTSRGRSLAPTTQFQSGFHLTIHGMSFCTPRTPTIIELSC